MIAIASPQGRLIKTLALDEGDSGSAYGFHSVFGFMLESKLLEKVSRHKRYGVFVPQNEGFQFRFRIERPSAQDAFQVSALDGCEAVALDSKTWSVRTARGEFRLMPARQAVAPVADAALDSETNGKIIKTAAWVALLIGVFLGVLPKRQAHEPVAVVFEPVKVTVVPEKQKQVHVPSAVSMAEIKDARLQDKQVKRAIQQNLGFLGLLGRKDLKKAIGGMPTQIKDASPGAGAGGTQGSGGEYLVGLGQGVKRATVGNTGVSGLGGIGTKGAGGGAGGYGNTMIGSGEGRSLSKVALSEEMVLEGGLDRAVIQATIAKYLSQVRACYEAQLQLNPGLAGQVTMAFIIDGMGGVSSSQVSRSTLGNPLTENCIATKMRGWKFPKPVGGVDVKVNYPFMLRPMGG